MDFECFFACNGGKEAKTIITNGDLAMHEAIDNVFTGTVHRLCSWQIQRNLNSNI